MGKPYDPSIDLGVAEERPSDCGCDAKGSSEKSVQGPNEVTSMEPGDLLEPDSVRGDKPLG